MPIWVCQGDYGELRWFLSSVQASGKNGTCPVFQGVHRVHGVTGSGVPCAICHPYLICHPSHRKVCAWRVVFAGVPISVWCVRRVHLGTCPVGQMVCRARRAVFRAGQRQIHRVRLIRMVSFDAVGTHHVHIPLFRPSGQGGSGAYI